MHAEQTTNDGFLGRREELQALYQRACAAGTGACESVLLAGSRGTGKTALLRHFAGYLFWKQDRVVPFLYPGNAALLGVADFSRDYLAAFLRQRLAFERRDQALLRLGLVCGEFGGYRAPDDGVLRDFVILLYEREIEGRSPDDIMRRALAGRSPAQAAAPSWDLSVPLAPRAELVIAESLEQIGKNLHIAEDTIGQLQLAVIEACINAIEHTKGGDGRLAASIRAFPDRLEVSVESPGQEFVQAETGEPLVEDKVREGPARGQGIRLMKRFADAVRFERTPHGTRVVLVKNLIRSVTSTKEGIPHGE